MLSIHLKSLSILYDDLFIASYLIFNAIKHQKFSIKIFTGAVISGRLTIMLK